jgi:hypothetical protein
MCRVTGCGNIMNLLYRWRDQALADLPSAFSEESAREMAQKEREVFYAETSPAG